MNIIAGTTPPFALPPSPFTPLCMSCVVHFQVSRTGVWFTEVWLWGSKCFFRCQETVKVGGCVLIWEIFSPVAVSWFSGVKSTQNLSPSVLFIEGSSFQGIQIEGVHDLQFLSPLYPRTNMTETLVLCGYLDYLMPSWTDDNTCTHTFTFNIIIHFEKYKEN